MVRDQYGGEEYEEDEDQDADEGVESTGKNGAADATGKPKGATEGLDGAKDTADGAEDTADGAKDTADGAEDMADGAKDTADGAEDKAEGAKDTADDAKDAAEDPKDSAEGAKDSAEGVKDDAQAEAGAEAGEGDEEEVVPIGSVKEDGTIAREDGSVVGDLAGGDPKQLAGSMVDESGDVLDEDGNVVGSAKPNEEGVADEAGEHLGEQAEGAQEQADKAGEEATSQLPGLNLAGPLKFEESGEVKDGAGNVIGQLSEGDATKLAQSTVKDVNDKGEILGENGDVLGKIQLEDLDKIKGSADEQKEAVEGEAEGAEGAEGEADQVPSPEVLEGKKVNKSGKVVDEDGGIWGELIEGDVKKLAGRACDALGQVWNDSGKVIGKAQALPEDERQLGGEAPFESFPNNKVHRDGNVYADDQLIGKVIEGNLKDCEGKTVDPDGDITDKNGNGIGKAERVEDPEPEAKVDQSLLAGKRVNKSGNVVDERGSLFGKVVEGDVKQLIGKMCDKEGNIWSESGEVIGRAELLPESQRELKKEGPFANYEGCKVKKDGKVYSSEGEVIGRIIEGDPKNLAGHVVDSDGEIIDSTGNSIGKAERYEEPEVETKHHPCSGYRVNSEGNVIDDNGDTIGKLVEGNLEQCRGIDIDDDGDIADQKGNKVGHVSRIADVKPEKSQEEIDAEQQEEEDKKLTKSITYHVDEALNKIKPILKDITTVSHADELVVSLITVSECMLMVFNRKSRELRIRPRRNVTRRSLSKKLSPSLRREVKSFKMSTKRSAHSILMVDCRLRPR